MRIGIVGTGNMGRGIGLLWAEAGHEVCFGARDRNTADAAVAMSAGRCTAATPAQAATFGPVVLWTVPDTPPAQVVGDADALAGRVVIDLTNVGPLPSGRSRAATLQEAVPDARVVKAFNTCSLESLELSPDGARTQGVQTLLAGEDTAALDLVGELASDIGMEAVRCGGLDAAVDIEGAARVLIGRILEREEFLLRLVIEPLAPSSGPIRLGARN